MIDTLFFKTCIKDDLIYPFCVTFIRHSKKYSIYWNSNRNLILEMLNVITTTDNSESLEIYVQNLNFEGLLILDTLTKHSVKFNILHIKLNIYFIEIFYLNKKIKLRCWYKLTGLTLIRAAELVDVNLIPLPINFITVDNLLYNGTTPEKKFWNNKDYNIIKHRIGANFNLKNEVISNCEHCASLMQKILIDLISVINIKNSNIIYKSYSTPGLSYSLFKELFNTHAVPLILNKDSSYFVRKAYFGGRCEVFGNPNPGSIIKYYDFNGMYAQCMSEQFHCDQGNFVKTNDFNHPGFHTIEYSSDFSFIPILPSRLGENSLFFANTKKAIGTFWYEEIQLFVKNGGVVHKIILSYIFETLDYVFRDFINYALNIKNRGGIYKVFGKLLVNSLYGGMGMSPDPAVSFITTNEYEYLNITNKLTVDLEYKINSVYLLSVKNDYKYKNYFKKNNSNSKLLNKRNVSYAAAITAKARIKLYNALLEVLQDGGKLLYCDTDSIYAEYDKANANQAFNGKKWLNFYTDGIFIAPKIYTLKNMDQSIEKKGIQTQSFSFDELKKQFFQNKDFRFKNFNLKDLDMTDSNDFNFCDPNYNKRRFNCTKLSTFPIWL